MVLRRRCKTLPNMLANELHQRRREALYTFYKAVPQMGDWNYRRRNR